jgi:hypothetical protein
MRGGCASELVPSQQGPYFGLSHERVGDSVVEAAANAARREPSNAALRDLEMNDYVKARQTS